MERHHANIFVNWTKGTVLTILEKDLDFHWRGNPDFLPMETDTFGIDEARDLKKWASGKPLTGEKKVCLVAAQSFTIEAQNALLKTLEEPPPGTFIFLILPSLNNLLPTLLSRVRVVPAGGQNRSTEKAREFLKSDLRGRLALIRNLSTKKEDKNILKNLIKSLESEVYQDPVRQKNIKAILTAKILSTARGSSPKMLLEWLTGVL